MSIFKAGNLVSLPRHMLKDENRPLVVLVSGRGIDDDHFSGTVVLDHKEYHVGEHDRDWDKEQFEQYDGDVTLRVIG